MQFLQVGLRTGEHAGKWVCCIVMHSTQDCTWLSKPDDSLFLAIITQQGV